MIEEPTVLEKYGYQNYIQLIHDFIDKANVDTFTYGDGFVPVSSIHLVGHTRPVFFIYYYSHPGEFNIRYAPKIDITSKGYTAHFQDSMKVNMGFTHDYRAMNFQGGSDITDILLKIEDRFGIYLEK